LDGNTAINPANDFIGTTDHQSLNFKTNNTNRLTINNIGDIVIPSDQQTLQFAATTTSNRPIMQMFTSGTLNRDRMIVAHLPGFPNWGIEYCDTNDVIYMRSFFGRKFGFELILGHMGIGVENPAFPLDAVGRIRLLSGTITVFVLSATINSYKVLTKLTPKIKERLNKGDLPSGAIVIKAD
jgi:hypothetical protein